MSDAHCPVSDDAHCPVADAAARQQPGPSPKHAAAERRPLCATAAGRRAAHCRCHPSVGPQLGQHAAVHPVGPQQPAEVREHGGVPALPRRPVGPRRGLPPQRPRLPPLQPARQRLQRGRAAAPGCARQRQRGVFWWQRRQILRAAAEPTATGRLARVARLGRKAAWGAACGVGAALAPASTSLAVSRANLVPRISGCGIENVLQVVTWARC